MKRIYVGYGEGGLAIIDSLTFKQVGAIKLDAHPESFQLEKTGPRIFVNVPGAKQIAVVDRKTERVTGKWPLGRFEANFPMALDQGGHRLFVGCRKPATLIVFDTDSGKLVANVSISADTDDLFYDGELKRLYISCGQGFIDVIQQMDL